MIEVNEGEVRERHLPAAWGLARGQIVAARKAHLIPKVDWRYERDVIIHPKGLVKLQKHFGLAEDEVKTQAAGRRSLGVAFRTGQQWRRWPSERRGQAVVIKVVSTLQELPPLGAVSCDLTPAEIAKRSVYRFNELPRRSTWLARTNTAVAWSTKFAWTTWRRNWSIAGIIYRR